MLLNRIQSKVNETVLIEQAGFRPNRSYCEQVLALPTHIEKVFQLRKKKFIMFVDFTAAVDTVWKHGLLFKLMHVINCSKTVTLIDNMLFNRFLQVYLNETKSSWRRLNNTAPCLFNLYTSDFSETISIKFLYADDLALVY